MCRETSQSVIKILSPKVQPWLQKENTHRKEKTTTSTGVVDELGTLVPVV